MAKELSNRHEAVIDYMLDNPEEPKNKVAGIFGYTVQYFYTMTATDVFKKALSDRREMRRGRVDCAIIDLASEGVMQALKKVNTVLTSDAASPQFALDAADTLMKRLGYGAPIQAGSPKVQVNVQQNVTPSELLEAQQRAKEVYQQPAPPPLPPPSEELTEHFEDVPPSLLGLLEGSEYEKLVHDTESVEAAAEADVAAEGESGRRETVVLPAEQPANPD